MKRYSFLILAATALVSAAALSGCQKDPETLINHLRLSDNAVMFDALGNQTYTVTVTSSTGEWTFAKEGDWMTVELTEDGNALTVTAGVNASSEALEGKITVSNAFSEENISVSQLGESEPDAPKFRVLTDYNTFTISAGGKKALACVNQVVDEVGFINNTNIYVIDLATDERTELTPFVGETTELQAYEASAISDDGRVVIITGKSDMKSLVYNNDTNEWDAVAMINSTDKANLVSAMSADGSIWVGYGRKSSNLYYPIKWVDGTPQEMSAPEKNGMDMDVTNGTMARGCSADGTVIYGSCWDNFEALYWNSAGEWSWIAEDLIKFETKEVQGMFGTTTLLSLSTPYLDANNMRLSSNGKWLAMNYRFGEFVEKANMFGGTSWSVQYQVKPLLVNIETGATTLIESDDIKLTTGSSAGLYSGGGIGVTNDGTFFYGAYKAADGQQGIVKGYAYTNGASVSTTDWIQSNFGIYTLGDYWVRRDFGDGKTVLGYKIVPTMIGTVYMPWYATKEGI